MTAPSSASAPFPSAGGTIGRYEIAAEIASGGMGRVYLARARGPAGFEKLVALKCIHPELASDPSFVDMFFDEARIAARIDHPNVCRVFDFGEADGRYFLAMEYLVGEPLTRMARKLAAEGSESHDEILARIVAESAEGLHAAHELVDEYGRSLQVIHRDVSPQNLFVTYDGGVRVVDFGIVSAQGRLHRTSTGSVKGKLAYMAPEQLRREPVDRRVDVWALGVVLWELLARRRLFRGASEPDVMLAVLNDPIVPPSVHRASIDPELDRIALKALDKQPSARYASARELSADLSKWIVSRGLVVGMAETASFMSALFPTERAERFEIVDRARRAEPPSPSPTKLPVDDTLESSRTRPVTATTPVRAAPKRSAWRGVALVLVIVLALAVGWGAATFGGGTSTGTPGPGSTPREVGTTEPAAAPPSAPEVATLEPVAPPSEPAVAEPAPLVEEVAEEAGAAAPEGRRRTRTGRSTPPATPAAVTTGHLHVETPGGWAEVFVDGRRLGRTPLDVDLDAGRIAVELRPFGLAPMSGDARMRRTVTLGERAVEIRVPLEP